MADDIQIGFAETEAERRAVYRFRYDVYVEEMGRYRAQADHEARLLYEPVDDHSRIFVATQDGEVVGTSRLTWGGDGPFPERMIEQFSLGLFLTELGSVDIAVGERGMITSRLRGTDLFLRMIRFGRDHFTVPNRIRLVFGACEPHLLTGYLGLGQRTYSRKNINSEESGYLIPLVTVVGDVEHLRAIGSPLANDAVDYRGWPPLPERVMRLIDDGSTV